MMGVSCNDLRLLLNLTEAGFIKRQGKICEIGAQQLSNDVLRSEAVVRNLETALGAARVFKISAPLPVEFGAGGAELQNSAAPFARDFWTSLGFDYTAIDIDESPGSVPLDLNFDEVPTRLRGAFDLVTNLGTTEHVCNQLNSFKAIHDLAAPGAVMIHNLPAGGFLNHGLFNYNMKFFWHLARSNDYTWLYANYCGGQNPYEVLENIRDFVNRYDPESMAVTQGQKVADYAIQVAFKKTVDIPFVPPIDVITGTKVKNPRLKRRYWTVFEPDLLEAMKCRRPSRHWALRFFSSGKPSKDRADRVD